MKQKPDPGMQAALEDTAADVVIDDDTLALALPEVAVDETDVEKELEGVFDVVQDDEV